MYIKFLGSGSAFVNAHENYQSNILIKNSETDDKYLLFDCGMTINEAIELSDIKLDDIDSIYISHLHADHAGGIEYVAFKTYFSTFPFGKNKPTLIGHTDILKDGWNKTWSGGLESIQGQQNTLETYFNIVSHQDNEIFKFQGIEMHPIQTVHVVDNKNIVPSYGLMFDSQKNTVFISGDSQMAPNQMQTFYDKSTLIFHDCEFAEYPGSVHAQFHELSRLSAGTKAKMWLYHYSLNGKSLEDLDKLVEDAGFAGIVRRGQDFEV